MPHRIDPFPFDLSSTHNHMGSGTHLQHNTGYRGTAPTTNGYRVRAPTINRYRTGAPVPRYGTNYQHRPLLRSQSTPSQRQFGPKREEYLKRSDTLGGNTTPKSLLWRLASFVRRPSRKGTESLRRPPPINTQDGNRRRLPTYRVSPWSLTQQTPQGRVQTQKPAMAKSHSLLERKVSQWGRRPAIRHSSWNNSPIYTVVSQNPKTSKIDKLVRSFSNSRRPTQPQFEID